MFVKVFWKSCLLLLAHHNNLAFWVVSSRVGGSTTWIWLLYKLWNPLKKQFIFNVLSLMHLTYFKCYANFLSYQKTFSLAWGHGSHWPYFHSSDKKNISSNLKLFLQLLLSIFLSLIAYNCDVPTIFCLSCSVNNREAKNTFASPLFSFCFLARFDFTIKSMHLLIIEFSMQIVMMVSFIHDFF